MDNNFAKTFVSRLEGKFSEGDLMIILTELECFAANYDIQVKERELVAYNGETFPEAFKVYMVTKKIEGKSKETLYSYMIYLKDFFREVPVALEEVNANDIRKYLVELQQRRGISNRTLDTRRRALNAFFEWSFNEGYISKNPCRKISAIKYESKEREPLNDEELAMVRDACEGDIRSMALIEVLYCTAARVSEIARLEKKDINLQTREVKLFGKGSKYRTSFLSGRAVVELRRYFAQREDDNPHVFVYKKKPYKGLDKRGIEEIVRQIGEKAGIDLFPHRMRHTSATDALAHGMKLEQVQQMLGHANPETTEIYAKLNKDNIKNAHQNALV